MKKTRSANQKRSAVGYQLSVKRRTNEALRIKRDAVGYQLKLLVASEHYATAERAASCSAVPASQDESSDS